MHKVFNLIALLILVFVFLPLNAQEQGKPEISCVVTTEPIRLDGILDEDDWSGAGTIEHLTMVEPNEGGNPSFLTTIKILADQKNLYIGVICYDDQPDDIVSFSKARDSELENEDHIKLILDTYGDGRNGYIFAINPFAARYDALVSGNGEFENPNWDGAWDAKTSRNGESWSAEIRIPVSTLTFKRGLDFWGFNIERRIERLLEVDRWTAISRDYAIGRTIHAGVLTGLPEFNLGIGMTPKASVVGKATDKAGESTGYDWQPSLDITQRITSDINAQLTINTDFAETEVDSRQTNLTRFPILYPEKRHFFLEGADIFDFGLSLGLNFTPYYSRRIGLYQGNEVPIVAGGKINGKINNTHFGGLVTHTASLDTLIPSSNMSVIRVRQNILKESSVGIIATMGDPAGRSRAWTSGVDFTYQTSTLRGTKNFLIGAWALLNNREGLTGDKSAVGIKIDYPNDLFDWYLIYRRIGDGFDPSLGFVPRNNINVYRAKLAYMPRPDNIIVRQYNYQLSFDLYTNLQNQWESYFVTIRPFNAQLESGDLFGILVVPTGENLKDPFEISDGVIIQPGPYHWMRYNFEAQTASKRALNGTAMLGTGGFYGGRLDQVALAVNWRLMSFLILELSYENNIGKLPEGNFTKDLMAFRTVLNFNSNLNLSSFIQYDNDSGSIGSYSRLRWTFAPLGDLFIVYKHNIQEALPDRWNYASSQLIVKLSYGIAL
ncbi:MAG TPA: hypothetical protein ENI20_00310 [Bacteroides sp.]|nr:hypothetical protein [Bacteroides sp.]